MSGEKRSVHARFTPEEWTEIGYEAVRQRLSMGQTVVAIVTGELPPIRKGESKAEPTTQPPTSGGEVKRG
ncbi:hypothetical protein ABZX95_06220 [Streptomyces sp. NPDC004232]|uniref:hypothetical protein n=1 Tax=Streptomyces sp. NPDC004232 TaxID=3154454 RepID=UPI0033A9F0D0